MIQELLSALPYMDEARAKLVIDAFWPMVKAGVIYTIPLAIASFICGILIALMVAIARVMPVQNVFHKILLKFFGIYTSIIRGTPLLVQLMIIFYALPAMDIKLDPVPTAITGFSLNVGAYAAETIRASILSVPKGQWEAGFSIGMTYSQNFYRIILPQAFKVAIPPLSNTFIGLMKETALASQVTITEMFRTAAQIANRSYDFLPVYIECAILYWCICYVLYQWQEKLEKRFSQSVAR
ncbi:MAG: amino acid ABC transporter permease [Cardiobacteriaceae bacterium]|nr:amino acid ABC transporter permease [Cardiobacteriaceae bacterium]